MQQTTGKNEREALSHFHVHILLGFEPGKNNPIPKDIKSRTLALTLPQKSSWLSWIFSFLFFQLLTLLAMHQAGNEWAKASHNTIQFVRINPLYLPILLYQYLVRRRSCYHSWKITRVYRVSLLSTIASSPVHFYS